MACLIRSNWDLDEDSPRQRIRHWKREWRGNRQVGKGKLGKVGLGYSSAGVRGLSVTLDGLSPHFISVSSLYD